MKDHEFLRVIEEICINLELSRPCISLSLSYFKKFNASDSHEFKHEIIIVSCIYLATKINEEGRKIRDILNMVYVVTNLYNKRNKELVNFEPSKFKVDYVSLNHLKEEVENLSEDTFICNQVPTFSLEKYNNMREDILKSEQHLLRILAYDLSNVYNEYYELLTLVLDKLKGDKEFNNQALGIYNDTFFVDDAFEVKDDWKVMLSIYLAYQLKAEEGSLPSTYEIDIEKRIQESTEFCSSSKKFINSMLDYYEETKKPLE